MLGYANMLLDTISFENMFTPHLFGLLVVVVRVAFANSTLVANDESIMLTAPTNFTYSINSPNQSSGALNTSSENMSYQCDALYGMYPDIGDCQDAFSSLQVGSAQRVFGERKTGLPDSVIALPLLVFGSMPSTLNDWFINRGLLYSAFLLITSALIHCEMLEKALCYIQLANVGGGPTAHASLNQIRAAANALILGCVADADSRGGIAINIGKSARFLDP